MRYRVIFAAGAMLLSLQGYVQTMNFKMSDVDVTLGGSARVDAGWRFSDYGDVADGKLDSGTDYFLRNPGNSRVRLKAVFENMTGYAEMGLKTDNTVGVRHFYGSYSFDLGGGNSLLPSRTTHTELHHA